MRNGIHADVFALHPIDELIREVPEKQAARIARYWRAGARKLLQKVDRTRYVNSELFCNLPRSIPVVRSRLQDLIPSLGSENDTHG